MKFNLRLRKEVGHGGRIPHGWRMAWYEPRRRVSVYYPAPWHRIARAVRNVLYRVRLALEAPGVEGAQFLAMQRANSERQRLADEYARGYMRGWRECFQTCVDAIEDEMSRGDTVWDIGALLTDADRRPEN